MFYGGYLDLRSLARDVTIDHGPCKSLGRTPRPNWRIFPV